MYVRGKCSASIKTPGLSSLKMIISQLIGGLGNQMFQYALGRALAIKNGTALKLDTSGFPRQTLRRYALGKFMIEATILSDADRRLIGVNPESHGSLGRLVRRAFVRASIPTIRERDFTFDSFVLSAPSSVTCKVTGKAQNTSKLLNRRYETNSLADIPSRGRTQKLHRGSLGARPCRSMCDAGTTSKTCTPPGFMESAVPSTTPRPKPYCVIGSGKFFYLCSRTIPTGLRRICVFLRNS